MSLYAIGKSPKDALRDFWAGGYETLDAAQQALADEQAANPKGGYAIYRIDVEVVQS